jgi:hypothetical protein
MPDGANGDMTMTPRTYDRIMESQNEVAVLLDALDLTFAARTRIIGAIRSEPKYRKALIEFCIASGQGMLENAEEEEERFKGEFSNPI